MPAAAAAARLQWTLTFISFPVGSNWESVQLNDATSPEEFADRIGERARKTRKKNGSAAATGIETKWKPATLPTKELIDKLTPNTPVFVLRYDGHMGLANSVALRLAGITAQTPDPPGGVIGSRCPSDPTWHTEGCSDGVYQPSDSSDVA